MKRSILFTSLVVITGCAADPADPTEYSVTANGEVVEGPSSEQPAVVTRTVAEVVLPNGNTVTFARHQDGGMEVIESGNRRTNAIGELPELVEASPYEIFAAIAPTGMQVPPELVTHQAGMIALRAAQGLQSTMPAGFRVDKLAGFYARDLSRAFNTCTAVGDWEDSVGTAPVAANCVAASGQIPINECRSNWLPPRLTDCAGTSCTSFATAGYHQTRSSVCGRDGTGSGEFRMGIKDDAAAGYENWFVHSLGDGAYYYHWYSHASVQKDFWRMDIRTTATGDRRINRSWWARL
jgi:hypothetical protein